MDTDEKSIAVIPKAPKKQGNESREGAGFGFRTASRVPAGD
jgi:hypothetical protein